MKHALPRGVLTFEVDSAVSVQAFAEWGKKASVPGPLIRTTSGTEVVVTLRNTIPDSTLLVSGLRAGTLPNDTIYLGSGEVREVRFRAGTSCRKGALVSNRDNRRPKQESVSKPVFNGTR